MSVHLTQSTIQQDKRLRRAILEAARIWSENALSGGWTKGYVLRDNAIDPDSGSYVLTGDNPRAFRLLRDLVRKGLLEERHDPSPDKALHHGEKLTLGHLDFKFLEKASRLLNELEPIDPDIDDMRVG